MTKERKEKIISSLKAGNTIRRYWQGGNTYGYLSHRLEGVKNLKEKEVEELRKENLLETFRDSYGVTFPPMRIKSDD
jgi:hypothetical protein